MTVPRATFRLQFREGMDFARAAELAPTLAKLGVSHLYASPLYTAPASSTHGYDVADHNTLDPALGGRGGFERLAEALKREGLSLLLDIVPNHMAASLENPWWRSVVEWGEASPYARHFDINWREPLTLPILGKPFSEAVADGEIALTPDDASGTLALAYFDTRLPLTPSSYALALDGVDNPLAASILTAARDADPRSETLHEALGALFADKPARDRFADALKSLDAAALARIHDAQPWRLFFWKEAKRHLSYRRFFEVTGLAGVRVEDPAVFADVHRLTLQLVRDNLVQGLRVDHVDGLADPKGYLTQLRDAIGPDTYLVIEKILGAGEELPADWPVEGTTGYEFAAALPELFVDPTGVQTLYARFDRLRAAPFDLDAEKRRAKTEMVTQNFETELKGLAALAARLSGASEDALRPAIAALIVAFPLYRTYGTTAGMPESDRRLLQDAAETARAGLSEQERAALDAVLALLLDGGEAAGEFRARVQQLTGPATAKSVEDTLFYRANQMIGLNEVGGEPGQASGSVERFHAAMQAHAARQPHGLLATATHDTKRGEDARARLYALSEAPDVWADAVARWLDLHEDAVVALPDGPAPEPETAWLLYQALAGAWPMQPGAPDDAALAALNERFGAYVEKALREAKTRTGWGDPDEAYESAVKAYAARLLDPANTEFLKDFAETLAPFIEAGRRNSLSQTLVKLAAPGVPDIYQNTDDWDLSLVDPDNRRPLDTAAFQRRVNAPDAAADPKPALILAGLALRKRCAVLFSQGRYDPLALDEPRLAAFQRVHGEDAALVVVSRFGLKLGSPNPDTRLPVASGAWTCALSGRTLQADSAGLRVGDALGDAPCALFTKTGA